MQRYTNNVTLQALTIDFSGINHFLFSPYRIDNEANAKWCCIGWSVLMWT